MTKERRCLGSIWLTPVSWRECMLVVAIIVAVGFAMVSPYLMSARQLSDRITCMNRLKSIAMVAVFCEEDSLTPRWEIYDQYDFSDSGALVCPLSGTEPAGSLAASGLNGHVDYILISGHGEEPFGHLVRAFELPRNHGQQSVNVACLSGAVFGMRDLSEFMSDLQQTNDRLAKLRKGM